MAHHIEWVLFIRIDLYGWNGTNKLSDQLPMIGGGGIGRKKGNMYYYIFVPPNYYSTSYFPSVVNFIKIFKSRE